MDRRPRRAWGLAGSLLVHGLVAVALLLLPMRGATGTMALDLEIVRAPAVSPAVPAPEDRIEPPVASEPQPVVRTRRIARVVPRGRAEPPPDESRPAEDPPAAGAFDTSGAAVGGSDATWALFYTGGGGLVGRIGGSGGGRASGGAGAGGSDGETIGPRPPARPPRIVRLPRVEYEPTPQYPAQARREEVQGVVVLELQVDRTGRVANARVKSDPGYGLGAAALAAALRFRFSPALDEHGRAVAYTIGAYRFRFVLPDEV